MWPNFPQPRHSPSDWLSFQRILWGFRSLGNLLSDWIIIVTIIYLLVKKIMLLLFSDLKFSSLTQIQSGRINLLPWAGLSWVISNSVPRIVATSSAPLNFKTAVLHSSSFLDASAIKRIIGAKETWRLKSPSHVCKNVNMNSSLFTFFSAKLTFFLYLQRIMGVTDF